MDNLLFGIQAIIRGLSGTLRSLGDYQLFWGFASGFLVSTIMHGFLVSSNPKQVPSLLFRDKAINFEKMYKKSNSGSYGVSFSEFSNTVDKVKFLFGLALLLFFIIILVALFRY